MITSSNKTKKRILSGLVVSNKTPKTIVVEVQRFVKHPKYGKYIKRSKRYQAHDESNRHQVGDQVQIQESRPMSRCKHFIVL